MKKRVLSLFVTLFLLVLLPMEASAEVINSGSYPTGGYTHVQFNPNAPQGATVSGMPGVNKYPVYKWVTDRPGNLPDYVRYYFKYTDPTPPICSGYTFSGWYMDTACTTAIQTSETSHGSDNPMQVYAKWVPNLDDNNNGIADEYEIVYTVSYLPGEHGVGAEQTANKTPGVDLTLAGALFTRPGYYQTGWAGSDGGAQAYPLNAVYSSNASIRLYPVWTPKPTYTITYTDGLANGAAFAAQSCTVYENDPLPAFSGTPLWAGHIFTGWAPETESVVTADKTYEAQWVDKTALSFNEAPQTYEWDGSEKKFAITGTDLSGFTVLYPGEDGWVDTAPSAIGTYSVYISRAECEQHLAYEKLLDNGLIISHKSITVPSAVQTGYTYDPAVTHTFQMEKLDHAAWYTISGNTRSEAGSQSVTVSLNDKEHTLWADGSTEDKTFPFTVDPMKVAEPTLTTDVLTYAAQELSVEITGLESYMTVLGGDRGTDAGSYEVSIGLDGNHAWADGSDGKLAWSIDPAEPTVTFPTGTAYVNDTAITLSGGSAAGVDGGAISGSFVAGALDLTQAGTQTFPLLFVPDSTNYKAVVKSDFTLTVTKRLVAGAEAQSPIKNAYIGTEQAKLGLPATVKITTADGKGFTVPVTWSGYQPQNLKAQTLTGTLDLSAVSGEVEQPATPVTASIVVNLRSNAVNIPVIYPVYPPVVEESEHGEVTVSPKAPHRGNTVTITTEPDRGYEIGEVIVTNTGKKPVQVLDKGNGVYSFQQPYGQVSIKVIFTEIAEACPRDNSCPLSRYEDLDPQEWYHNAIHCCLSNEWMQGKDTAFEPDEPVTRATLATMLWHLDGEESVEDGPEFEDVEDDVWYAEAVRWAVSNELMSADDDKHFEPDETVCREELASVLYRYEQLQDGGFEGNWMFRMDYEDVEEISEWAYEPMCWMVMKDVLRCSEEDLLEPQAEVTRAEAAEALYRYYLVSSMDEDK